MPLLNSVLLIVKFTLLETRSGTAKSVGLRVWFLNSNFTHMFWCTSQSLWDDVLQWLLHNNIPIRFELQISLKNIHHVFRLSKTERFQFRPNNQSGKIFSSVPTWLLQAQWSVSGIRFQWNSTQSAYSSAISFPFFLVC